MPYTYKGIEYELKPLTLGVKAAAFKITRKHSELIREYTREVNVKAIEKRQQELARLREKIRQKEERAEDTGAAQSAYDKAFEAFENDTELQADITYYLTQQQVALSEALSDEDLLKQVIPKILDKPVELDFSDPETEPFIMAILQDFFFKIRN